MFNVLLLIAGFIFLLKGADFIIDGASSLARRFHLSGLLVGLTIIAVGVSMPELVINVTAGARGLDNLAIGAVIGSNIANILLVLGVAAMVYPLSVKHHIVWQEIPLALLITAILGVMVNDRWFDNSGFAGLSRLDGIILIILFGGFLYYIYSSAKSGRAKMKQETPTRGLVWSLLLFAGGAVGLAIGGQLVIVGAENIIALFRLSQTFVGLTIIAIGAALPELVTAVKVAIKRQADIAIGAIVGANILNIGWALGVSAIIRPLAFVPIYNMDILILLLATFLLFLMLNMRKIDRLGRGQGALLVILYLLYMAIVVFRE